MKHSLTIEESSSSTIGTSSEGIGSVEEELLLVPVTAVAGRTWSSSRMEVKAFMISVCLCAATVEA
jgi:hypothetical protein